VLTSNRNLSMPEPNMRKPIALDNETRPTASARAAALVTAVLLPATAWAHPGHGGFWDGLLHAFHGFDHTLAALAVGIWSVRLGGRALCAVPLAFAAAMAVGLGLAAAGIAMPVLEPVIAASVLLLGMLIALDARFTPVAGALLVAAFAPFHAAAHVAEMPGSGSVAYFAAGLLASTALLHGIGMASAHALRARALLLRLAALPIATAGLAMVLTRAA
jgi:urease accessory protein